MNIEKTIEKIKKDLNNSIDISSRILKIKNKKIGYLFLESVSSDDKISDFLVRSLINEKNKEENIYNSKLLKINYEEIPYLLGSGFTIIITKNNFYATETKANIDQ